MNVVNMYSITLQLPGTESSVGSIITTEPMVPASKIQKKDLVYKLDAVKCELELSQSSVCFKMPYTIRGKFRRVLSIHVRHT